jgi:hypothetical protein
MVLLRVLDMMFLLVKLRKKTRSVLFYHVTNILMET